MFKENKKVLNIIFLHACILLYTGVSILGKVAAAYRFLSLGYILIMAAMAAVLGIYAILWQQVIKPFEPSVAYSNKSVTIIWTTLFSVLVFKEKLTLGNILGIPLIISGIVLVAHHD